MVGHNLPPRTKLYGRQPELARLHKWVVEDGCHLVGLFGIGGQGKTALVATLVRDMAEPTPPLGAAVKFQRILWQSLLNAPPLAEVMQEWFYVLSDQAVTTLPTSLDQQFSQLLDYLRRQRCLLVLDNLESILQGDERGGYYRPGYEVYGQLLRRLVEGDHHSCLLLTSRERPQDLTHLEEDTATVRFLTLAGLSINAGQAKLQARGVVGAPADLAALVQHYSGNPLALKLVAETIQNIFAGNIAAFLQAETLVFDDIRDVLDQQFARLAPLEHELLVWLAIVREPTSFDALRALLAQPPATRLVLEAMRSLQRRSLVENYAEGFGLQNVVLEYTTAWLVDGICAELVNGGERTGGQGDKRQGDNADEALLVPLSPFVSESLLNRYALILAQAKEYVRASQTRLLLQAVVDRLVTQFGGPGAEQPLQQQLALLQTRARLRTAPSARGYAAANLLHLLLQLGVDLSGYDFSQLSLRQLYLRGISLPQTNFAQAAIIDTVFTEPFGLVRTVAFSPDGQYVAAGTSEGAIYLWRSDDQQLVQVLQLHDQFITELAFGLRATPGGGSELVIASASDNKRIGVWSLAAHAPERWHIPLVHEQQGALRAVNISPDGEHVTGVDSDGHVFVWAVNVHAVAQLVHHFATQPTRLRLVAFSRDGQTVVVGHREGRVQFWQTATGEAGLVLTATTGSLGALALSPDGQTLVTGSNDGQLCLWTLPAGQRQQVIETKAGIIDALAFSPDGTTLASTHGDRAVRVWCIDSHGRPQLRHTLIGHTHSIWSVAFGPSPKPTPALNLAGTRAAPRQLLVTGSNDQTVRVWDAEHGQALYTLAGQPRALTSLAIAQLPQTHPIAAQDGAQLDAEWVLAAVGYDQLVHVWQGRGVQPHGTPRRLRGQSGPLYAVAMSLDGRFVASAGRDQTIDLWDVGNGKLRQTFHGHVGSIYCLAFQPGGALLASGGMDGALRLWSLPNIEPVAGRAVGAALSSQPLAVLQATPHYIYQVAFSPDGRLLASVVNNERSLHLWDVTVPQRPELVITPETLQKAGEEALYSLAFSPDSTKLACGGNELVQLWDIHNSAAPLSLQHHTSWIVSVAFSPDGTTLASASVDGVICLWAVAGGALRASLLGHSEQIYSVAFSPDSAAGLSGSADGTSQVWDSQTGECVNTLRVEGPYAGMNITGVTGITEAQKAGLKVLGAIEKV
ncbi:MAG: NACHT domain-containing protein [Chloroflexi bacterium]|nr:NACHT domain-containing protein [Chloroflexota bacterium]